MRDAALKVVVNILLNLMEGNPFRTINLLAIPANRAGSLRKDPLCALAGRYRERPGLPAVLVVFRSGCSYPYEKTRIQE